MSFIDPIIDAMDSLLEWLGTSLKQTSASYCDLETADSQFNLVGRDGSLVSVMKLEGVKFLVGEPEFEFLHERISSLFRSAMKVPGHNVQFYFQYDLDAIKDDLKEILNPARQTAKRFSLDLDDLFKEKVNYLAGYCARESTYVVISTTPRQLSASQIKDSNKRKKEAFSKTKVPAMRYAQGIFRGIPELRDSHDSYVRSILHEFKSINIDINLLEVHEAVNVMRMSVDPNFTHPEWRPYLPGDPIPRREKINKKRYKDDVSDIMWPPLSEQIIPRDGEIIDLRTARVGDKIYAPMFIKLFPRDVKSFASLFGRVQATKIPWRIAFFVESEGLTSISFRSTMAAILSFANSYNPLIHNSKKLLDYIQVSTDDAVVRLKVMLATWAPVGEHSLLRSRAAELAKALQGWGNCDVAEMAGDPFEAALSSAVGVTKGSPANPSVAPLSDVTTMLPFTRPSSPWKYGAILFRSPDGKPWPYQPGSTLQTTWIDLVYARPGSGKSVLSNALNLALCLSAGIERLPRIAIIDIGPSSSGLISLLREALPREFRHQVAYHRLRMSPEYSINVFDTQLGCRFPTPQERAFLVNFITLLATPLGSTKPYDGIADMSGLVVDELYKNLADDASPNRYTKNLSSVIDERLEQLSFQSDEHTSWWEVVDYLYKHGYTHEATLAQRYAMPVMADAASICRAPAIEDLFGKVLAPTGENLIQAFARMIASAIREYPVLSRVTAFDLGESRIVSLDLDEVAKTGGEAADRQTAVMYMLARYVLARHYYLTLENLGDMPAIYRDYHRTRIMELREDPKRLVFDEFHRTSKAQAVRDQVIVDMREGRKWKVQIALISQSLDDFDATMVEFATSVFVMDAGPVQAIEKTAKVFGLTDSEKIALRTRVHGPRLGGGTFLAQFATKYGLNTQLLTNTLGPIELWAFSTTVEDARVRNELYEIIGAKSARQVLAYRYPGGSLSHIIEQRLASLKETGQLDSESGNNIIKAIIDDLINDYNTNPIFKDLRGRQE